MSYYQLSRSTAQRGYKRRRIDRTYEAKIYIYSIAILFKIISYQVNIMLENKGLKITKERDKMPLSAREVSSIVRAIGDINDGNEQGNGNDASIVSQIP